MNLDGVFTVADLGTFNRTGSVVSIGESLTLRWTVENTHNAYAPTPVDSWVDAVVLSEDGILGGADDQVLASLHHTGVIGVGGSYSVETEAGLPGDATGTYHLFIVTDSGSSVFEFTYEDNNAAGPHAIDILRPDLTVEAVHSTPAAQFGDTISLTYRVRNRGAGSVLRDISDRVYLSSDSSYDASDRLLREVIHSDVLGSGEPVAVQRTVTIPVDAVGDLYLLVVTDVAGQINEMADEGNNTASSPLTVELAPYADLWIHDVVAPSLTVGDPASVTVGWTVTNVGTGPGVTDTWVDRIIASADAVVGNADDRVLAEYTHTPDRWRWGGATATRARFSCHRR